MHSCKVFMKKRQNDECSVTNFRQFLKSFVYEFWYISALIESPRFYKWLWILNWSKWIFISWKYSTYFARNIIIHRPLFQVKIESVKLGQKEKLSGTNWHFHKIGKAAKVKRVSNFWITERRTYIPNSQFKVTCKNVEF